MNVQCCVGYRVCFGTRAFVLCKSRAVKIGMLVVCLIAGRVFNTGGKDNPSVGGKRGYLYSSSCDLVNILRFVG